MFGIWIGARGYRRGGAVDGQAEDSGAEDEEPESGDGLGHQVRDVDVSGYLVQGDGAASQPPQAA